MAWARVPCPAARPRRGPRPWSGGACAAARGALGGPRLAAEDGGAAIFAAMAVCVWGGFLNVPPGTRAAAAAGAAVVGVVATSQLRYQKARSTHVDAAYEDSYFVPATLLGDEKVDVHYKRVDADSTDDRAAVALFLHGFGSNTSSFDVGDALKMFVDAAAPHVSGAAAYDRPGFGLTERPERVDNYADAQAATAGEAVLRELTDGEDRDVVLIAHSAGAAVAAILADRLQARCRAVVLLAPSIVPPAKKRSDAKRSSSARPSFLANTLRVVLRGILGIAARILLPFRILLQSLVASDNFWQAGLQSSWVKPIPPNLAPGYSRPSMIRGWDLGLLKYVLSRLLEVGREASTDLLARVGCPVLILHGDKDRLVPISNSTALIASLPTSAFVALPGVGHSPHEESPSAFSAHAAAFVGSALAAVRPSPPVPRGVASDGSSSTS